MSRLSRAVAALVVVLSLVGLVGQAVRGNGVVNEQRSRHTVANATIDDRYYDCLSTQAHSLVSSSTPVRYRPGATLWEAVLLNKSAGSWITVAPPGSTPSALLGIAHTGGPGACLGDVVFARIHQPDGSWVTRTGTGASVPGSGPPPAPPL